MDGVNRYRKQQHGACHRAASHGVLMTVVQQHNDWEALVRHRNFGAPISLETIRAEIDEAIAATTFADRAAEVGDILSLLLRYAATENIDALEEAQRALQRNIDRSLFVIQEAGGFTGDWDVIRKHWSRAKKLEKQGLLPKIDFSVAIETLKKLR